MGRLIFLISSQEHLLTKVNQDTVKVLNFWTPKIFLKPLKILKNWPYIREMPPKDADGIANSEDSDQTALLGAV